MKGMMKILEKLQKSEQSVLSKRGIFLTASNSKKEKKERDKDDRVIHRKGVFSEKQQNAQEESYFHQEDFHLSLQELEQLKALKQKIKKRKEENSKEEKSTE